MSYIVNLFEIDEGFGPFRLREADVRAPSKLTLKQYVPRLTINKCRCQPTADVGLSVTMCEVSIWKTLYT